MYTATRKTKYCDYLHQMSDSPVMTPPRQVKNTPILPKNAEEEHADGHKKHREAAQAAQAADPAQYAQAHQSFLSRFNQIFEA